MGPLFQTLNIYTYTGLFVADTCKARQANGGTPGSADSQFQRRTLNCPEWDDIDMTLNFVGSACTSILQVVKGSSSVSCSSVCPVSTRVCVAAALSGDHNYTEMNTVLREMLQTRFHAQSTSYNT